MFRKSLQLVEKRIFRTLNTYLEPLIHTGVASPGLTPVGAVVLEIQGRKSGRTYKVPMLASEFANLLLISTARSRSQWIKNLAATPETKIWLRGQSRPVTAYVIRPAVSQGTMSPAVSPLVRFLIGRLRPLSKVTGASFAILEKQTPQRLSSSQKAVLLI
jgi:hypothetical protein